MRGFGERLTKVFDRLGQLCVGIDPHPYLLEQWGLPDTAAGLREFGLSVVAATVDGDAGIIKPQVAFFERHGAAGFSALEDVIAAARHSGLLVIADAKRGDLGTSVEAYGQAWLTPGSPLEADAMTISAYMGVGSIQAPMELAEATGKGLFVLAATSNPEARSLQTARLGGGQTVASSIVSDVVEWNRAQGAERVMGSVGLVLGATVDFADYAIDLDSLSGVAATPVLAPGFGHQGASFSDLGRIYGAAVGSTVVAASRSILHAGPDGVAEAVAAQAAEVRACRA
ncbi:orotidine-5'-phosphate decarboxylase [Lacisediminihabitans sp. G11-30]|uniref:Orotidine-5'-phosphate decarboxylase n=1 Tax=Lacisediminihabitans changchengi TaxID=2787634 RepID=A0A934SPW8_9MICO|nr:orotidine-5'-phosphate decarboxylase [Lacisediminihabitans changchengi]MBK4348087.1 orotidine-5'-phosphate decarboxylase [Lacisediminihabitans changchengi]